MSVDSGRGEVEVMIDGQTRVLRLSNRRQRLIATSLGVEGMFGVQSALDRLDLDTVMTILEHGCEIDREDLEDAVIPLVPAVKSIAEAMMLATWGPGGPPEDPPETGETESPGDGSSNSPGPESTSD